jgi:hypothetical protein
MSGCGGERWSGQYFSRGPAGCDDRAKQFIDQLVRKLTYEVALPVVPVLAEGGVDQKLLLEERVRPDAVLDEPPSRTQGAESSGSADGPVEQGATTRTGFSDSSAETTAWQLRRRGELAVRSRKRRSASRAFVFPSAAAGRSSPAAPSRTVLCNGRLGSAAPALPPRSVRSRTGSLRSAATSSSRRRTSTPRSSSRRASRRPGWVAEWRTARSRRATDPRAGLPRGAGPRRRREALAATS